MKWNHLFSLKVFQVIIFVLIVVKHWFLFFFYFSFFLFTFEENGDQFILYEIDDVVYGAKLNEDDSLKPIEEDEWELVEKIFNEWNEENNQDEDE